MTTISEVHITSPKMIGQSISLRGVAYSIDIIISVAIDLFAKFFFSPMLLMLSIMHIFPDIDMGQGFYFGTTSTFGVLWGTITILSLHIIYFTLFEGVFGRTIGKVLLGLSVTQYDGTKCSISQAAIRGMYRVVDSLFFGLIAYLNMKPPLYQRIGDKKAKTIVIDIKQNGIHPKRIGWSFFLIFGLYFFISGIFQLLASLVLLRFI